MLAPQCQEHHATFPADPSGLGARMRFRKGPAGATRGLRLERVTGIEPAQPAWKAGTLPLSYTRDAGSGSEENTGPHYQPVIHPQGDGGGGWIRTNVGARQRIYSPSPLATRAPLRRSARSKPSAGGDGLLPFGGPCQRSMRACQIIIHPAGDRPLGIIAAWPANGAHRPEIFPDRRHAGPACPGPVQGLFRGKSEAGNRRPLIPAKSRL